MVVPIVARTWCWQRCPRNVNPVSHAPAVWREGGASGGDASPVSRTPASWREGGAFGQRLGCGMLALCFRPGWGIPSTLYPPVHEIAIILLQFCVWIFYTSHYFVNISLRSWFIFWKIFQWLYNLFVISYLSHSAYFWMHSLFWNFLC